MLQPYHDHFSQSFSTWDDMQDYHSDQVKRDRWPSTEVSKLLVVPLDSKSSLVTSTGKFAPEVSEAAIKDTADNLGLAIKVDGKYYPLRDTAYKSLLDRAKVGGSALPKLPREDLARVLNSCLRQDKTSWALLLIRDQKVAAVHSGDEKDYSVLPIDSLLNVLKGKLDERFPGNQFLGGYCDHSLVSANWTMPVQQDDLLGTYQKTLVANGKSGLAKKLVPGIRFSTSDTGISSAKVSAMLVGLQYPIHIGSILAVDHRRQTKVADFSSSLDQLFAQFGDSMEKLNKLHDIVLQYPVNAMTRVCKKLALPKKAALEAISMFEMAYGGGTATAHDVFMALQEIIFLIKNETPTAKLMTIQENLARALHLRWPDYDLAKAVEY